MADSSLKDSFLEILGGISEAYAEVVTAENSSASPAVHDQASTATQPTGEPVGSSMGVTEWFGKHWLSVVIVVVALMLLVAFLKWLL